MEGPILRSNKNLNINSIGERRPIKQSGLKGKHSIPKFEDGPFKGGLKGGIQLTMFISPELETGLRALGGCAAMAALSVKFKIAKSY